VFVSMVADDLLIRTARYEVPFCECDGALSDGTYADDPLDPLSEENGIALGLFPLAARLGRRRVPRAQIHPNRLYRITYAHESDEDSDFEMVEMPEEWITMSPSTRATAQYSYDEDMEQAERSPSTGEADTEETRPPNHIGSLPFETEDPESEAAEDLSGDEYVSWIMDNASQRQNLFGLMRGSQRLSGHDRPASALADAWQASRSAAVADHERGRVRGKAANANQRLMTPIARFHLDRVANRCIIRFDPPVCARYILIKMWNADNNVTSLAIQSLTAKGFSGHRYIPVIHFR